MVTPVGASLFTRKEEQGTDYDWKYAQTGICQLLDTAKKVYATSLCQDHAGDIDTVKFAVIQQGQRLGLLVAGLQTSRCDFSGRVISTTLYVEFNSADKEAVLNATTTLLNPSDRDKRLFLDYAEDLLKNPPNLPKPISLPKISAPPTTVAKKKGLVFSPINERDQYAGYLAHLPENFCFISTGYVGTSQYQELESVFKGGLLVLTLSENTKETSENIKRPSLQSLPVKKWLAGLVVIGLVSVLSYYLIHNYHEKAQQKLAQLEQVKKLESDLVQERAKSAQLEAEIQKKEQEKSGSQRDLEQQIEQIKKERDAKIAELTKQIEQNNNKDAEITKLRDEKAKADKRIQELETGLASLGQQVQTLTEKNKSIDSANKPVTPVEKQETAQKPEVKELNQSVEEVNQEAEADLEALNRFLQQLATNTKGNNIGTTVNEQLGIIASEPKNYRTLAEKYCGEYLSLYERASQHKNLKLPEKINCPVPDEKKTLQQSDKDMEYCILTCGVCPGPNCMVVEVASPKGSNCPEWSKSTE